MRTLTSKEYVFDVREGLSFSIRDNEAAQWILDLIDDRDELRAMGALDCREICKENEKLRHDVVRHVAIAAQQAGEIEELRSLLLEARHKIWHTCGGDDLHKCLAHRIDAAIDSAP